ncbi:RNA polymerase sigma factor [Motilibacter deserti]|uniref:Sigma-70 family RNA polymerase sigma factor n=1 Tax=Motilibacter deserti TaxID=2714956 RepID=A0ABX0GX81_9ACTN|nr:sigma-70 family RNA polymerase sigma factor [Motilibacter deserti]NHC15583.1 sigma-70 family RNA polymerase sigma factor [Motilibacter deserti]
MSATRQLHDTRGPERLEGLLQAADAGDLAAWSELVGRYEARLRAVGRSFRLPPEDVADAMQVTWMRLFRHAGSVRTPSALGGWLVAVMRNECRDLLSRARPEVVGADLQELELPDVTVDVEDAALGSVDAGRVLCAVRSLPPSQRRLIHALFLSPFASYEQISVQLQIPVGSIGPTRRRALARLRELLEPAVDEPGTDGHGVEECARAA